MIKKIFTIIAILMLGAGMASAQQDPLTYFKQIRESTYSLLPESFRGELTGSLIQEKLQTIPRDYVDRGKTPVVMLTFSKTTGVKIEVANVDELYKDMFEQYVRFFTLGPILSTRTDDAALNRYDYSFAVQQGNITVMSVQLKNSENKFQIYINKDTMQIDRVDYFTGAEMLSSVIVVYQSFTRNGKTYKIPVKFIVKTFEGGEQQPDIFEIRNVTIN